MTIKWQRGADPVMTAHFRAHEFECHCGHCTEQHMDLGLLAKLEFLRQQWGAPLGVSSGFRCKAKQQALRDAGKETSTGISTHELGQAADIACSDPAEMPKLAALARTIFKAVGEARSFVHVDMRADKQRNWTYVKE